MTKKDEQKEMWGPNHERYAQCVKPFGGDDAANAACEAFFADVSAAREKHGIADVEIIVQDSYVHEGEAAMFISSAHFGDVLKRESMLAYAFGRAKRSHELAIAKLLEPKD